MYWLGVIGMWLFSDGLYSISLYSGKPAWTGKVQTLSAMRMVLGLILIAMGAIKGG